MTACLHCHHGQLRDPSDAHRHAALGKMARLGFIGCAFERAAFMPFTQTCPNAMRASDVTVKAREAWVAKRNGKA